MAAPLAWVYVTLMLIYVLYINVNISYHIDRAIWCVYTKNVINGPISSKIWQQQQQQQSNENKNNKNVYIRLPRDYAYMYDFEECVFNMCDCYFFFIWSLMPFFLSFSFLIQGDDTKKMLLFDVTMWINVFCLRCVYHLIENLSALFSQENFCRWQQHTQKKTYIPDIENRTQFICVSKENCLFDWVNC